MSDDTVSAAARRITLSSDLWGRIVLTAQESDDWRLRTLIEQAAAGARLEDRPGAPFKVPFTHGGAA